MACLSCSSRCAGPALTAILSHAAHYWQVLCALASGGSSRRTWLLDAGILPLLHRLTMERARDVAGGRGTDWLYSKECRCSLVQTFDGGGRVTILLKSVALLKNVLTAAPPCSAPSHAQSCHHRRVPMWRRASRCASSGRPSACWPCLLATTQAQRRCRMLGGSPGFRTWQFLQT